MTLPSTKTDCIEWPASRHRQGYGHLTVNGKYWLAHRWEWTRAHGPIPSGMCVLHKCDNPPCINLEHLFLGTQVDNIMDCKAKGRNKTSRNVGVKQWKAKIDEATAREIKSLKGAAPLRVLGERFGMSKQAIWDIQNGRNWKHI